MNSFKFICLWTEVHLQVCPIERHEINEYSKVEINMKINRILTF